VVKKKLDAEAVVPGLTVGVKSAMPIQRAKSARISLMFIFSPFFRAKGMLLQEEQRSDESKN